MNIKSLEPIEYWTEEMTIPLYGMSDTQQPMNKDNFLCLFSGNTCTLFFINNRHMREAERGYAYFKRKNSVQTYTKRVQRILQKFDALKGKHLTLSECIQASREWNGVYMFTEAIRLRKFEELDDEKTWRRFQKLAELRLKMRKKIGTILYPKSYAALLELAKENGIASDDLFFYTYDELQNLLTKHTKPPQAALKARKKGYVYVIHNGKKNLYTGARFKTIKKKLGSTHGSRKVHELNGKGVSKGIVRGQVTVLLHNSRKGVLEKTRSFKKGRILVTEMTRPESLPAGRRAKAIITDEGGILSHAAILARESKIPCVVGTKFATKVLKNGDTVEVDAEKGSVRILKHAT